MKYLSYRERYAFYSARNEISRYRKKYVRPGRYVEADGLVHATPKRPYKVFRPKVQPDVRSYTRYESGLMVARSYVYKGSYTTPGYFSLRRNGSYIHMWPFYYIKETELSRVSTFQNRYLDPFSIFDPSTSTWSQVGVSDRLVSEGKATFWTIYGYPVDWNVPDQYPPDMLERVEQKILKKLGSREASIGEFVGEFKQCVNLFSSVSRRIATSLVLLTRGNYLGAIRTLGLDPVQVRRNSKGRFVNSTGTLRQSTDSIANRWLELQYGWKPLLSDLHGLVKTLAEHTDSGQFIKRAVARAKEKRPTNQSYASPGLQISMVGYTDFDVALTVRYTVDNPDKHLANQLQLNDPLSIAWNLLPYSFVVDWFVDIGGFLENYNATTGLRYKDGCKTMLAVHTSQCSLSRWNPYTGLQTGPYQTGATTAKSEGRLKRRDGYHTFPSPQLLTGAGLTVSRLGNAMALLLQNRKRLGDSR